MEEWKQIKNYHYSISSYGRLRNDLTLKILKERIDNKGYHKCDLYDGQGNSKGFLAHRLVAFAFLSAPKQGQTQINHIDGNPKNNKVENLEWVTPKQNSEHAVKTGLFPRGGGHHLTILSDDDVRRIRELYKIGFLQWQIADKFGIHQSVVSRYVNRKRGGAYR